MHSPWFILKWKLRKIPVFTSLYTSIAHRTYKKGIKLVNSQGHKFYVDARDEGVAGSLLKNGVYNKIETDLYRKLVKPGMTFIDIGANIGYFTLLAAKIVGDEGNVYAFEPDPHNFNLLLKNIKLNGYTNIIPAKVAISNKIGTAKLFLDANNLGGHSLAEENILNNDGFVKVQTTTLDSILNGIKIDFIKIDVQGAEGLIVQGAENVLNADNLMVTMEFDPVGLTRFGTDPVQFFNKLKEFGFKIKLITHQGTFKPIDIDELLEMNRKGIDFVDLLLTR